MVCNRCKKEIKGIYIQIDFLLDNLTKSVGRSQSFIFCLPCWIKIKNLDGVPMMFKGKVKQILKDWGLKELFK